MPIIPFDKDDAENALSEINAAKWLLDHHERELTAWEIDFLTSLTQRSFLTPKQHDKLDEVWHRIRGR